MQKIKNFIKDNGAGLLTVLLLVVFLVLALAGEPNDAIKGAGGWLLVRAITLVWSVIVAVGSYSKWKVPTWNKNLLYWIITWVVFWQAMASFYVNDWCVDGL